MVSHFEEEVFAGRCDIVHSSQVFVFTGVTPIEVSRRMTIRRLKNEFRSKLTNTCKSTSSDDDGNSMHRALNSILMVAQCFALCPVQGITSKHADDLRFTWKSLKVMYSIVVMIGMFVSMGFAFLSMISAGITFKSSGGVIYYLIGLLTCVLFLNLGIKWPELAKLWQQMERNQIQYGYPKNLRMKLNIITGVVLTLALVEYCLANFNALNISMHCSDGSFDAIRRYFIINNRHLFPLMKYSNVVALFALLTNIFGAFYWSFADLFVMLVSVALASRFKLLNYYLKQIKGKVMSEGFWRGAREDYNALSFLTSSLDSCVSSIILLCFATNLYYVCQQLLSSMSRPGSVIQMVYVYLSFGYLLLRTVAMSLYAASIYDESKVVKEVLYAVPSHSYQVEVHRFLVQVATDDIALTGLNFFPVTRTVLLTLAGTIVTYEVVLVQFGSDNNDSVSNLTALCLNLTRGL